MTTLTMTWMTTWNGLAEYDLQNANPSTEPQGVNMSVFMLTLYVLIWPVIVAGTLFVIAKAFFKELRQAKREGRSII